MADKSKTTEFIDKQMKALFSLQPALGSPGRKWEIPVVTKEEIDSVKENAQKVWKEEAERLSQEEKNETEFKKLTLEKEREIVNLIKTAEEVEIEEVSDSANGFNVSALVSQSGVGASAGKDNAVSNYRRYKFKRGGEKTEIETPSDDQTEK